MPLTLMPGEVHPAWQPYSIFGHLDALAIGAYDTNTKRRIFCAVTQEAFAQMGGDGSEEGSRQALAKNWQKVEAMLSDMYDRMGADESGRVILSAAGAEGKDPTHVEASAPEVEVEPEAVPMAPAARRSGATGSVRLGLKGVRKAPPA